MFKFGFGKKKKKKLRDAELLKQYKKGKILQVNNDKDNKEYFKGLDSKEEAKEEVPIEREIKETNIDELPEIEKKKNIPDLLILGKIYLDKGDNKNAKEIYEEIKTLYAPKKDKELHEQILNYYKKITG